jgi:alkanesulfonate monooxygenase SsuD/methylene tetrahydromethanopterin reductase-like flavin-dependent oxidoreductase (luciferase family)
VSHGRFIFGIGAGWNAEEMGDHNVAFKDRWKVTRERVLAMREIWTKDEAEFHGQFVNFDPLWCWPKPVQAGGPPILLGAWSKWSAKRVVDYCNGWMPVDGPYDIARAVEAVRAEASRVGRSLNELDLSIITGNAFPGVSEGEAHLRNLNQLGFNRIMFLLTPTAPEAQWPVLEQHAKLIRAFR